MLNTAFVFSQVRQGPLGVRERAHGGGLGRPSWVHRTGTNLRRGRPGRARARWAQSRAVQYSIVQYESMGADMGGMGHVVALGDGDAVFRPWRD